MRPTFPVSAARRKVARSLLSLLKNWFGPIPSAKRVVPGLFAMWRASSTIDPAGAQVISSVVFGSKWARYSFTTSKTGRQVVFVPSFSVTSTAPSRSGSWTRERCPTSSRLIARGALAFRSHQT